MCVERVCWILEGVCYQQWFFEGVMVMLEVKF